MAKEAVWSKWVDPNSEFWSLARLWGLTHWSRTFEYPWVFKNAGLLPEHVVLEAGGGSSPLQLILASLCRAVVNVDLDYDALKRAAEAFRPLPPFQRVLHAIGDLRNLWWFEDGCFDRVTCVSAVEHCDDPGAIVRELWRVLKPGGRLLLTIDVAEYRHVKYSLDLDGVRRLLAGIGLDVPPTDAETAVQHYPDQDPSRPDKDGVDLRVLCCYVDKE